jgi:diguanylate cyclase (GGDEF)-like protein
VFPDRVVDDVAESLRGATTVAAACQDALEVLARHTDAMSSILLRVHDHLRGIAATGSWQVYSAVAPWASVSGRVYASGVTEVVTNVARDDDYIPLGPSVEVEICAPVTDAFAAPVGVLNVEFVKPVNVDEWRLAIERVARAVGLRIDELGGPPAESRSEKLVRHGLTLATAGTEPDLAAYSLVAARDVAGLDTAVLVLNTADGIEVILDESHPTSLGERIAAVPTDDLFRVMARAQCYGASYSLGDPATLNTGGFEALIAIGVRTLISIPVGIASPVGGVLLVADETPTRPDPETVNLITMLAAQAWNSRERIRMLAQLHERASSDPLTGLGHHGAFGERLALSIPGRTAVFAIDIDGFKNINDTYGHQAGDRALVTLAEAMAAALRQRDELYRIGGDEFAAIVDVRRPEEALGVADRLIAAARTVDHTISVGIAVQRAGETANETLRRADQALYHAKRGGRDAARLAV